jgi:hypothetical protein
VSGRGPLDDIGSAMLAQLLSKHGFDVRTVDHDMTSRANIAALEVTGIAVLCVSYLEILGHPPNLRYLLRRLRHRLPQVPLLVGLWPVEDDFLANDEMRRMMGADGYSSSLREMVIQSVDIVRRTELDRRVEVDTRSSVSEAARK